MRMLAWDNELETVAQRWADQCKERHDSCRNVANLSVGQNIWTSTFRGAFPLNLSSVVNMWYNEVTAVSNKELGKYAFVPTTGHYTQLVWAETTRIGCGFIEFNDGTQTDSRKRRVVCNYGLAGNMIRSPVYKAGPAASQCPPGTARDKNGYPNLCS